jgi:hypothetical protein
VFYAPVYQSEYIELEVPAPEALGTKFWSANRGNPKTGRPVHQTKNGGLLIKLKFKVQKAQTQFSIRSLCHQRRISMALRPNPPINRNCYSPLRGLPQSGYWQRWASGIADS